jgi:hypothetical protein
MKVFLIACAFMTGLTSLSVALGAVPPSRSVVTDDTALYQHLSEIKVAREGRPNFDGDIERLAGIKSAYRERLPSLANDPRLQGPMKRISSRQYRHSGARKKTVRN